MKQRLLALALTILSITLPALYANAQTYTINTGGTVNTCGGTFYDSGGNSGQYANSQNYTMTFCSTSGNCVQLQFTSFSIESGWDFLRVYDGPSNTSPLIGTYTGSTNPGTITSTTGCLTINFTSDGSVTAAGWAATLSCVTCPPPPSPNAQDCLGAIPVCQNVYSQANSYSGSGNIPNEINPAPSCLGAGELNDVWYTFTVQQSGNLCFSITPNVLSQDYDWAVYNLTNANCSDIYSNVALEVSCNFSGISGVTGPNGQAGSQNNPCIPVTAGQTYVINVSNYSSTQNGYTINFGASTAVIFDNIPPNILSVNQPISCGSTQLTFNFSEWVLCNTVQACDFTLTGPGGPYTITGVSGAACSASAAAENTFTLTVSPAITTSGAYSLCLGTGCGSVTDQCGNVAPAGCLNFNITGVNVTTTQNNVTCFGGTNGSATATASGGNPPYTYVWQPGNITGQTASGLAAGTYTVTATSATGCAGTATVTITQPTQIIATTTTTAATCGNSNGSASVSASGGTGPYTYSWAPSGGTGTTANGLTPGTYTVTVTGAGGCTTTATATIANSGSVTAGFSPVANQCFTGNSFSFTNTGSTGAGITYSWNFGGSSTPATSTAQNPSGVVYSAPGTYTVTQTVTQGSCSQTYSQTVTVYPNPTVTIAPSPVTLCAGGSQALTATSSVAANFTWSPATGLSATTGATVTASPTVTTTYTVTATTTNGCTGTATVTVTVNPLPTVTATAASPTICAGGSTTITASGASTYSWSPSTGLSATTGATVTATPTATTTYTVTGTTAAGCTSTTTVTITVNPVPIVSATASPNPICAGASAILTATGANTYSWSPSTGLSATTGATVTATPSATTTYTVTGTSAAGCVSTATVTVTVNPIPSVAATASPATICAGASSTLTASGANTYSWAPSTGLNATTGASVTATPSATTTYTVTGTSAAGCVNTATVTVTVNPLPSVAATASPSSVCPTQSSTLTATGANTYTWSPATNLSATTGASVTSTPTATITYTVTGTSAAGCQSTATVTVNVNPSATIIVTPASPAICSGSSTTLTASGASTYSWSPSTGLSATTGATVTANPAVTTTYTVTGTTASGCTGTTTVTVTVNPLPVLAVTPAAPAICAGGSTTLTASGASTYSWSPSTGLSATTGATVTATPAATTTYTVTGTTAAGCTNFTTVTVTVNPLPTVSITPSTATICTGGSTTLTANGANTYSWLPAGSLNSSTASTVIASPGVTTTYTVTGTSAAGCSSTATATITVTTPATLTISSTPVSCNGGNNGTATVTATGGNTPYTYTWSPSGGSAATATGLTGGTYTVTVATLNGCTSSASVTITQPAGMTLTTASVNATCGSPNGQASVTVTGGTGPYTYSWAPTGGTASTATGLLAGSYTVTVTDANSCTQTANVAVNNAAAPSANITSTTNVSCNGGSNGSLTVAASGGTGPYTYSWAPSGGTGTTATGLAAGTYTVTVTDANGCVVTTTGTVTQPPALTASITASTNVSCFGGSNGIATVTPSGGTAGYTYNWAPTGGSGATGTGLSAGAYTVTVTDANGCTTTASVTITQPVALTATSTQTAVSCNGGNNGTATVTATGGTPGYTYSWAPSGGTAATATGLTAGTYTATVTDANGCTTTSSVAVTQPTALTATTTQTNVTCNGGSDGTATATPSGGTAGYTYFWAPTGGTGATATGLTAGSYTVTVTDANGCSITATVNITQPTPVNATTSAVTSTCNQANGQATVTASGGTGTYTYAWAPSGGTAATATGLAAGTYTVTVTDVNGCTTTATATIGNAGAGTASISSSTNVSCNGGSNGSATATITGGSSPYTYLWSPGGQTTATATNLSAGTYTVTVTDANSCAATATVTITEPGTLTSTMGVPANVSCNGGNNGSVTVTAAGGTPAYTYSWAPSGGTGATASNLSAGSYTVTVTDANGCITTSSVTISQPTQLTASVTQTNVSCNGGSNGTATVTANGGTFPYTYFWSPAGGTNSTATGLTAGTYTVAVTDANGCSVSSNTIITEPSALTATTSVTNTTCSQANGSATVNATGGTGSYSYLWQPGGQTTQTITGVLAGSYTVTVTDLNACTYTITATITNSSGGTASIASSTNVSCFGGSNGSATATITGGTGPYTYAWAPSGGSTATANNLAAGTYTVTVNDANNCPSTATVTITEPPALATTGTQTAVSCNGGNNGSATVTVTGGTPSYTYSWTPSGGTNSTASSLAAGSYTVTATDANGCVITRNYTIAEPTAITLVATSNNTNCTASTGSATVNASGGTAGYTYLWNPSGQTTQTATNLASGTYTVTVTDANGCTQTASTTVGVTQGGTAVISSYTDVTCFAANNGSATVSISGGGNPPYSYQWLPGNQTTATATNLATGTYTVTVTDTYGCITSTTVTISQPPPLAATTNQVNVSCAGGNDGSVTVTPSGGTPVYTYFWTPGGNTTSSLNNLQAGNYSVQVTDANGCTITNTVAITEPPAMQLTTSHVDANCNQSNGSAQVNASGGTMPYTYLWSPGGQTTAGINGIPGGTYSVTVTDFNGCSQGTTVTVNNLAGPAASISASTNVSCFGGNNGTATVSVSGGTAPFQYLWSNGQTIPTATNLAAGSYTVTATDVNGCVASAAITITEPAVLSNNISFTNPSCFNGSNGTSTITVSGGTGPYGYSWAPGGQTTAAATNLSAGTYTVTVTDANGCIMNQPVTISNPPAMTAAATVSNVTCNNLCNGTATGTATNGTGPFTYQWNDPSAQTTQTASGLCAGSYTVTITDANGCTATAPATITAPVALQAGISSSGNATCFNACDGYAQAAVIGGTAPYTYSWSPGNQSSSNVNNLCAGSYTVTVTDANGCTATATTTITQPAALTASITSTNVTCYQACDGTATVAYSGGTGPYTFLWSPSLQTVPNPTGLCAGTHTVTVTDANGCSVSASVGITEPTLLSASVSTVSPSNCGQNNGSACVSVIGGVPPFTYQWNDPNNQTTSCAGSLVGSSYTVTVTDGNGCLTTAVANVNDIAAPTLSVASSTNVTCAGGSNGTANINITGGAPGYTTLWSPGGQTTPSVTNLNAGVHTVTVTDAAGCVSSISVPITQPSPVQTAIISTLNPSCYLGCNGTATVGATGGTGPYTYLWNDPSAQTTQTATGLCAASYTVTVTDSLGCTSTASATLTEPAPLTIHTLNVTPVSCNGGNNGAVSINVTGGTPGYSYGWQPNAGSGPQITNLASGSYNVLVTDANGCTQTQTFNISEPAALTLTSSTVLTTCGNSNGSVTVNPSGGVLPYSYLWNDPNNSTTSTVTGLPSSTYQVTVTDGNGCTATLPVALNDIAGPAIDSLYYSPVLCSGTPTGTATIDVKFGTMPYQYDWQPGGQTTAIASGLNAGTYTVTVTDANGCIVTGIITVTQPNPLQVIPSGPDSVCYGQWIQAFAAANGGTPGYDIYWDNGWTGVGPQTDTLYGSTSYTIFAVDTNGCQSPPVTLGIYVSPPITVSATDVSICDGESATISATATGGNGSPFTYSWSNGPTGSSQTVSPAAANSPVSYVVTVSDGCSLNATDTATVTINPVAVAFLTANDTMGCAPLDVDFSGLSNIGVTYIWNFGDSTSATGNNVSHLYTGSGLYDVTLTVITANGCTTTVNNNQYIDVWPVPDASFNANPRQTTAVAPTITFSNTSVGGNSYHWDFNFPAGSDTSTLENPVYTYADTGSYIVELTVTNSYGCIDTAYETITVIPDYILFAPNAFTPDGDGLNDYFFPQGIGIDPKYFEMFIFDRWGNMIYRTNDINKPWDGKANDGQEVAQIDVYVWIIKTKDFAGEDHEYIGHVSLIK